MQQHGRFKLDKKGQVALFVIIAVIIVAAVALVIFLKPGQIGITPKVTDPQGYIEKCMNDAGVSALAILTKQGGSLNPTGYAMYEGNKVSYLCYTKDYYSKCVNQQPMLKYNIENEITSYTAPKVQGCISQLKNQLEKKGYSVSTGGLSLSTTLQPKKIIMSAEITMTIAKEETKTYDKFESTIISPVYDQAMLAQEIVNSETHYGDYDQLSYMLYDPQTDVEKKSAGENTIYLLRNRADDQRFLFAVRSYIMPPGF